MTNLTIFYVVFIAQIFLLSVYYPAKLIQRMRYILRHYPESTHPKLYPKSTQYYQNAIKLLSGLNGLTFILGWVIVYLLYNGSLISEEGINPLLPWGYFMLQMIPMWLLHIFGFRMSKFMQQKDNRTQKTANLTPRNLFHYISPMLFGAVILAFFTFVIFAFYLEGFKLVIGSKAFIMTAVLIAAYAFFFILIFALIYGKKLDPYQSPQDRNKNISLVIKTYCYTMIVSTCFMGFSIAMVNFELKSMMPVAMSMFLQFVCVISTGYVLMNSRIEDIDFDVYKPNQ